MKPIYIEEDEEITSVVDKIKNVEEKDIELIFPKKSPLIRSIVNLKILKRQSESLEKNITVSTSDVIGKALAQRAKLNISNKGKIKTPIKTEKKERASSINVPEEVLTKNIEKLKKVPTPEINKPDYTKIRKEAKQKKIETLKERFQKRQKSKLVLLPSFTGKILIIFFIACFIIGMISVIFFLPQATVLVSPKTEPFSHSLETTLVKDSEKANPSEKIISYEVTSSQKSSEAKTFPATGERDIGQKAKGQIIIYNKYSSSSQPLVASTRFIADSGELYRLTQDIEIPGAKIKEGQTVSGRITATIEADEAGEEYNLESETPFTIPGLSPEKQEDIKAASLDPISGGDSRKINIITSEDLKKAKELLLEEIVQKTVEDLTEKVPEGKTIIKGAIKNEIIDSETNGEEDKETKDFKMSITAKSSVPIVSREELNKILFDDAKNFLPKNKKLLDENFDDGIEYEKELENTEEGEIKLKISLNKKIFTEINQEEIRKNISGKDTIETKEYLMTNPYIYKAEIMLWPFWVKKVPRIKNKIKIIEKQLE